jgi:glycosyltransferase involved in cell wall biosynthesis
MLESRPLTVLQLLPALESGGVERGTLEVARALVERGHRALVMSAGGRQVAPLVDSGAAHFTWPVGKKSLTSLLLVRKLRQFLREQKVDIVHARSRVPAWIAWLAWRGMDPATRPRFVTTVHGLYRVNAYSRIMVRGERVIAVSQSVRDYIAAAWPDVPMASIEVIPRGVDSAEFPYGYQPDASWKDAFFRAFPGARDKTIVTLPGRITRLKGHERFIDLCARLKRRGIPVHGLIAGGASQSKKKYLAALQRKVHAANLVGDISFTGQRSDMREILASSQLVLSLSRQPESFGRTTLEALRLGVPVAGFAHGGVGEILSAIYPAGLLPLEDDATIATRIEALLLDPPPIPRSDAFTLGEMLTRTLGVYETLACR